MMIVSQSQKPQRDHLLKNAKYFSLKFNGLLCQNSTTLQIKILNCIGIAKSMKHPRLHTKIKD